MTGVTSCQLASAIARNDVKGIHAGARSLKNLIIPFVRLFTWHDLPGSGRIYKRLIGDHRQDSFWHEQSSRRVRGKFHGYFMDLNLGQWSERYTYFYRRFYDLPTQLILMKVLRKGDRFVDVGANIGMISLLASRLVGSDGVVDAFEPNPQCVERIRSFIDCNQIENIRLHNMALGDKEGCLPLTVPLYNSGEGTLARISDEFGPPENVRTHEVPVGVGDIVLSSDPIPPVLVKIDVEGFEYNVLTGLTKTLLNHQPIVVTEVVASHLARDGRVPKDVFDLMKQMNYSGFEYCVRRKGGRRVLSMRPADESLASHDVLWVPNRGVGRDRLDL